MINMEESTVRRFKIVSRFRVSSNNKKLNMIEPYIEGLNPVASIPVSNTGNLKYYFFI